MRNERSFSAAFYAVAENRGLGSRGTLKNSSRLYYNFQRVIMDIEKCGTDLRGVTLLLTCVDVIELRKFSFSPLVATNITDTIILNYCRSRTINSLFGIQIIKGVLRRTITLKKSRRSRMYYDDRSKVHYFP